MSTFLFILFLGLGRFVMVLLPGVVLTMTPLAIILWRRDREFKAEQQAKQEAIERRRQARADEAERVLRSFGA